MRTSLFLFAVVSLSLLSVAFGAVITPVPKTPYTCPAGSAPSTVACVANTNPSVAAATGTGTCCSCPKGSFSTDGLTCRPCASGVTTVANSGVDLPNAVAGATTCRCVGGFGDYDVNSRVCRVCPPNTYSNSAFKCVACPTGQLSPKGSMQCSAPASPCSAGSAPGATGACAVCPAGQYSADGRQCRPCINGKVVVHGVDVSAANTPSSGATSCQCDTANGFGDYDPATLTCRQCPINTSPSAGKCVACAANTYAVRGSSSCSTVSCPTATTTANAFYMPPLGTTAANCIQCGYGTSGLTCSNLNACRCAPGFANFDKAGNKCYPCPNANSITIYTDMTKQDESSTTCFACPTGTFADTNKLQCLLATGAPKNPPVPLVPIPASCFTGHNTN